MAVRLVSSLAEFHALVKQPQLTVVDFFATWCQPCKTIAPFVDQLAVRKPHVNFCKVDVNASPEVMREYPVRCMPTFMFFKAGKKVDFLEGGDVSAIQRIVSNNEVVPPAPLPPAAELAQLKPKELLEVMKTRHINASGLLEKSELLAEIEKYR